MIDVPLCPSGVNPELRNQLAGCRWEEDDNLPVRSRTRKTARWSPRVSLPQEFEGYVTKLAPHKALNLIT